MPLKNLLIQLLAEKGFVLTEKKEALLADFLQQEENQLFLQQILDNQHALIMNWNIKNKIDDILRQQVVLPNGMVGTPYKAVFDVKKLNWQGLVHYTIESLDDTALVYNEMEGIIEGTPTISGDSKFKIKFKLAEEAEDIPYNEKIISIIINPNPKSLWKDIASDRKAPFWKEDNVTSFDKLGEKHLLVASKRGRSHANAGTFREDDFAYKFIEKTGWSIVAVSDGAGSASLSRQGSNLACNSVIDYFVSEFTEEISQELDGILAEYQLDNKGDAQKKLNAFIFSQIPKAALYVHKNLEMFSKEYACKLKDLNATLIFTLFKKYEFGYAILSFGVGDCPIALMNKEQSEIKLMNWLDVGEFGGGTRFITMPEIFSSDKFYTRFGFKLVEDFSYLFLMTDGIYDPKFVVEANLDKVEKWQEFLRDLGGENPENAKVDFNPENTEIEAQIATWMDFWSPGNHDDRTLAIVF